jgi:NADPH:quinone reductase-like Zn-dependent oxidoreductase
VGWPITPGFEFAGIVEAIGDDTNPEYDQKFAAKGIKVGSEVFGVTRFGAYATHVCVPK